MTCVGSRPNRREAASNPRRRRHYPRASDLSVDETRAVSGARGMTRYVHDREHHSAACTHGAGLAVASRRGALSRLASAYGARKRPGRSEEALLHLLAAGLEGPRDFGRGAGRSAQTAFRLRLARRHQRAVPDRGGISSGEGAARHPAHAPTVLFGHRLVARIFCHKAIPATSACQGRRFTGAPSAAGYGDIALCGTKRPPSLSIALSSRTSATFQIRNSLSLRGTRSFRLRQRWRHEVRAFDAPRTSPSAKTNGFGAALSHARADRKGKRQ